MHFVVDGNRRRLRLLEAALELEEEAEDASDQNEQIVMLSPKAARRFGIRPRD